MKRVIAIIILVTMCLTASINVFGEEAYPVTWIRDDYKTTVFTEDMLLVYRIFNKGNKNGYEYGFMDKNGKEVVPLIYDQADSFSEGLAAVMKDGKCGYIDKTGKVIVPLIYDSAWSFSDGLAKVRKDKKWYYIDKTGKIVIGPLDYNEVSDFKNGFAKVEVGMTSGLINKTGKVIVPLKYLSIQDFREGLAIVSDWDSNGNRKYGAINTNGKLIIPIVYDYIGEFNDGVANATKNYKCGVIDRNGKVIVQFKYNNIESFNNGLAQVIDSTDLYNHKYGFINKAGKFVIPFSYNRYDYQFSDGLSAIEIKDKGTNKVKVGFVDTTGRMVIKPKYGAMTTGPQHTFRNGFAIVSDADDYTNAKYGIIDRTGKEILPIIYDIIGDPSSSMYSIFNDGLVIVHKDGKVGAVDTTGRLVIPMIFDGMYEFSKGVTLGKKDGRTCIIKNPIRKAASTSSTVVLNGREISFDGYNIDGNNYLKLRDIAFVLNGTEKQFNIKWDNLKKAIDLTSYEAYIPVGGELSAGKGMSVTAILNTSTIYKDGNQVNLYPYEINGNNYFKLRDIAQSFDFSISFDGKTNKIIIDTSKSYVE